MSDNNQTLDKFRDLVLFLDLNRQTGNTTSLMNTLLRSSNSKFIAVNQQMIERLCQEWSIDRSRFINASKYNSFVGIGGVGDKGINALFDGATLYCLFKEAYDSIDDLLWKNAELAKENQELKENNCKQNCKCNCDKTVNIDANGVYLELDKVFKKLLNDIDKLNNTENETVKRPHVDAEAKTKPAKDPVDELEEVVTATLDNVSEVVTDMIDAFVDGWVAGRKNRQK